jgi:hypothetical protein
VYKEYAFIESQIEKKNEKHQTLHVEMSSLLLTTFKKHTWKTIERKKTKAKKNLSHVFLFQM